MLPAAVAAAVSCRDAQSAAAAAAIELGRSKLGSLALSPYATSLLGLAAAPAPAAASGGRPSLQLLLLLPCTAALTGSDTACSGRLPALLLPWPASPLAALPAVLRAAAAASGLLAVARAL